MGGTVRRKRLSPGPLVSISSSSYLDLGDPGMRRHFHYLEEGFLEREFRGSKGRLVSPPIHSHPPPQTPTLGRLTKSLYIYICVYIYFCVKKPCVRLIGKKKMRERDGEARRMQSSNETRDKAIT